mgnify:CR=1 FL=1
MEIADKVGAKIEFGNRSLEYYKQLEKGGHGGKDFGYVY